MIETKSMKNIREIKIETKRVMKTKRVMNIRLIVYKIAQIIRMTDEISKNEIEMIVRKLTLFLSDECRDFLMMMKDHCKNFLIEKIDDCRDFASIEMKIKMIVSENYVLLMIHEMIVLLIVDEMIL